MTDRLPLCEASFRALEDAYERQWRQAHQHQMQQQQQHSTNQAHTPSTSAAPSAGAAAAEMRRLLAQTRELHQRFASVCDGTGPPFSAQERESLLLLGFDAAKVPPTSARPAVRTVVQSERRDDVQLGKDAAVLRQENAQLLSALAWYRFREEATRQSAPSTAEESSGTRAGYTSAKMYAELRSIDELNTRLCLTSRDGGASAHASSTHAAGDQSAVDVAIRDVLATYQLPPQVRVGRVGASRLYRIDRLVEIDFASPQSCTLVVRDPDAVEPESDLRAYLLSVYGPLLQALRWSPPAQVGCARKTSPPPPFLSDTPRAALQTTPHGGNVKQRVMPAGVSGHPLPSTVPPPATSPLASGTAPLSHLSYEELLALKRAAMQRIERSQSAEAR